MTLERKQVADKELYGCAKPKPLWENTETSLRACVVSNISRAIGYIEVIGDEELAKALTVLVEAIARGDDTAISSFASTTTGIKGYLDE